MLLSLLIAWTLARLCFFDLGCDCPGRYIRLWRNAAEPGPKRAEVDRSVVAVSRLSASEAAEVAIAAGVDERFCLQLVFPGMVGEAEPCDGVVFAIRAENESVQQDVHAGRGAAFVQGALGCFRIEYHEHAAVARGRRHCAPAAQLGQDFIRNAGYGLTRLLTQCVESAIGQHIAHRPGAAQASGGFNQTDAYAGPGRANRSPDACSASTNNENVICVFHNHSFVLDGDPGIYWHCQEPSHVGPMEKGACPPFSFRESGRMDTIASMRAFVAVAKT